MTELWHLKVCRVSYSSVSCIRDQRVISELRIPKSGQKEAELKPHDKPRIVPSFLILSIFRPQVAVMVGRRLLPRRLALHLTRLVRWRQWRRPWRGWPPSVTTWPTSGPPGKWGWTSAFSSGSSRGTRWSCRPNTKCGRLNCSRRTGWQTLGTYSERLQLHSSVHFT